MLNQKQLINSHSLAAIGVASTVLCLFALLSALPLSAQQPMATVSDGFPGRWQRTTPGGGGAFATIGAGPTGIVLAASDLSGAYRSQDRGKSWDLIGGFDGLTTTHVGSVGFDPQDGNILYLGTNAGIYRSQNGGDSVTQVLSCPPECDVSAIRFAPNNPQIGYAAFHPEWNSTQGKVYKTTNRGLNWSQFGTAPNGLRILKLLVHPTDPNTVYLLSGKARFGEGIKGIYRSTDGGASWTRLGASLGDVLDFTQDLNNPSVLYLTTYQLFETGEGWQDYTGSLYRSSDGGNTWAKMSDRTGALWLDRDDLHRLRILDVARQQPWDARRGVWESADNGTTWTQVSTPDTWGTGWTGGWWVYHESYDGHAKTIGEDLFDPDALWWTNSRYVMATFDDGRRFDTQYTDKVGNGWQSRGFDNVVMFDVAVDAVNPNIVYAGYYDIGCWRSEDGAAGWQNCNQSGFTYANGDTSGGNSLTVEADPTRGGIVWMSQAGDIGDSPDTLLRSNDGGKTWSRSDAGLPSATGTKGALLSGLSVARSSPANQRTLFVTAGGNVYASSNDGVNWNKRLDCNGCRYTAVDAVNSNLVYAGGEAGLWRSTAGGAAGSWQQIGLPEIAATGETGFTGRWWRGVSAITSDPSNANWVYVAVLDWGKGIYRSKDGGNTWQKLWSNDYARNVAVSPANPNILYASSSSASCCGGYDSRSKGILRSDDQGATWKEINDGLEWPFVGAIAIAPSNANLVLIGAQGNGTHKRTFADSTAPTATPTPRPTTQPTPIRTPTPPASSNLVKNGEFNQGDSAWIIGGPGMTYTTNDELCLYYSQAIANLWDAGVAQGNIPLVKGKRYQLRLRLWSQRAAQIKLIVGQNQAPWTNYWNQLVSLPADNVQVYSYEFTMNNKSDAKAGLFFHVGGHTSPVLCIDKVELVQLGGITGKLRNVSNAVLPNIRVTAYRWNGGEWGEWASVNTAITGQYIFNNLTPDTYRLRYDDPSARYKTEFYNNVVSLENATAIAVHSGVSKANINAVLAAVASNGAPLEPGEESGLAVGQLLFLPWMASLGLDALDEVQENVEETEAWDETQLRAEPE